MSQQWQRLDLPSPVDVRPLRNVTTLDLLQSLDRCEHGRHGGDSCFDCPDRAAVPNFRMDHVVGHYVHGQPITVRDLYLAVQRDNFVARQIRAGGLA